MVSLNPHLPKGKYINEVKRCVEELGFVGIKLHPQAYACDILSPEADKVFEIASQLSIPVMIHTGRGIPFASPATSILRAKQYPKIPIILAHSGFCIVPSDALVAGLVCNNIYLETSWCIPPDIIRFIKKLGSERVMFASDSICNIPTELTKYYSIGLSENDLENCLGKTAIKIFKLPI